MARARAVETPRAREHSLGRRAAVAGALKVAWRKVGRITRQAHEGTIAVTNGAVAISGPALLGQNALTARLGTVRAAQADVVDDATAVAGIHVRASRDVEGIRRQILLPGLASAADRVRHEQQREEKAYLVRGATKSDKTMRGATIPQPFNLTKRRGKENARREALAARIRDQQMVESTFHPKTTEARNRVLINQILEDDSLFEDDM